MYMDGADFMPTSRFVLYGYHFKSIAAAGPIVGVITAANLWGWAPAILWLMIGVTFIGWASDYSAIMMSVRNDGNSLSAISHRLIRPTHARKLLFLGHARQRRGQDRSPLPPQRGAALGRRGHQPRLRDDSTTCSRSTGPSACPPCSRP